MSYSIGIAPNIRKSPYFDATVEDGVRAFSVYNHMYIPAHFGDLAAEYDRLVNGVVMWDVAAQRQVEIRGPDAEALVTYLCARDISRTRVGQGRYVPICNHEGLLINDPVLLKLSARQFWLSIADSDIELWAQAIAAERGYDVEICEPDVSPLAVQGPRAEAVISALFGDWIGDLGYFGFRETSLDDIPLVLARSGWSKQGGFELYLRDGNRGGELWRRVREAGRPHDIGPGAPNDVERIESGLLSWGSDCRLQVDPANPFELGLDAFVDLEVEQDFVGKQALQRIHAIGPARRRVGFFIDGETVAGNSAAIEVLLDEQRVGSLHEIAHSPRLGRNIGVGLVDITVEDDERRLWAVVDGRSRALEIHALPFIR